MRGRNRDREIKGGDHEGQDKFLQGMLSVTLLPSTRISLLRFPLPPKHSFKYKSVNEPIQEIDCRVLMIQSCPKVTCEHCHIGNQALNTMNGGGGI